MVDSAQVSFGSAIEFVEEDLPRADLAQLEAVLRDLEGGVWSGTIRAAEREKKKASVVELRAALDHLREAAVAREQARIVRKERPASTRREFLEQSAEALEEAQAVEDERDVLKDALESSVILRGELEGDLGQELPAAVPFPTAEELVQQCGQQVAKYAEVISSLEVQVKDRDIEVAAYCAKESAKLSEAARRIRAEESQRSEAQAAARAAEQREELLREELKEGVERLESARLKVADLEAELGNRPKREAGGAGILPAEPEFVEIVGDQDGQHGWKRPPRILQELVRAQQRGQPFPYFLELYRASPGPSRDSDELLDLFPFLKAEFCSEQAFETLEFLIPILTGLKDVVWHLRSGGGVPLLRLEGPGFKLLDDCTYMLEEYVLYHLHSAKARELAKLRAVSIQQGALSADAIGEKSPMEVRQDFLAKKRGQQQYQQLPASVEEQRAEEDRVEETRKLWKAAVVKEQVKNDIRLLSQAEKRETQRYMPSRGGSGRGRGGRGGGARGGSGTPQGGGGS